MRPQPGSNPSTVFSLCVFCGSRDGIEPAYADAARALGRALGQRGWQLVYGGGNVGLMGILADATLAAGGRVVGVIPRSLVQREVGHTSLHELHVVDTMHERKQMMADRAHAFLALPGGIGTLEEFYEVWTWRQLGYHQRPIGLLNVAGFYEPLLAFMRHAAEQGFLGAQQMDFVHMGTDAQAMLLKLRAAAVEPISS